MTQTEIKVLVGSTEYSWQEVVSSLLAPKGVDALVARHAAEAMDIITSNRLHVAIVDVDCRTGTGMSIVRVIRGYQPMLPCIMVANGCERAVLTRALELDVFSVLSKPVDLCILQQQMNRLFVKRYNSNVFSE